MSAAFAANLVGFVRNLRELGFGVGPATVHDLTAAVDVIGLEHRADVKAAFAAILVARPTERQVFDDAFERFFGRGLMRIPTTTDGDDTMPDAVEVNQLSVPVLASAAEPAQSLDDLELPEVVGASVEERLATRDFRDLTPEEAEQVRRIMARMLWRPAEAESRRWVAGGNVRPDMRRTMRRLVGPTGDLMPLAMAERKPRRRPLVVLADVSGSMERYAEMFIHFLHAAHGRLGRVETFVFATRLSRITRQLRQKLPQVALRLVGETVADWSGGTKIGESLHEFNQTWSRRVTRGGAIGLIISDGWDTGPPELMSREMERFSRAVHRVVWLNPLAGRANYSPETRGMQAAMPHIDDLLAAANLLDLREVVRLLESIPARR